MKTGCTGMSVDDPDASGPLTAGFVYHAVFLRLSVIIRSAGIHHHAGHDKTFVAFRQITEGYISENQEKKAVLQLWGRM